MENSKKKKKRSSICPCRHCVWLSPCCCTCYCVCEEDETQPLSLGYGAQRYGPEEVQETQYNFTSSAEPAIQAQPRVGVARGGTPQLIIEPEPPLAADEDPRYLLDHSRAGRTVVFSSTPPPTTSTPRGAAAGPMLLVVPRASSREARAPTPEVTFGCEESDSGESTLSVNPVSGLREESSGEAHVPQSFRITWVT